MLPVVLYTAVYTRVWHNVLDFLSDEFFMNAEPLVDAFNELIIC